MEYRDDPKKAFGIIESRVPNTSDARIKVVGIIGTKADLLDKDACLRMFIPAGYVRAYHFFDQSSDIEEGDLIQFQCEKNERALVGWDAYKMIGKARKMGSIVFPIKNFVNNYLYVNLSTIGLENTEKNGSFYGLASDKYILGKLVVKNGQVICPAGNIRIWDKSECRLYDHNGQQYLLEIPTGESRVLDCLTEDQLFEWFRLKLRSIHPKWVDLLDKNAVWRKDIPAMMQASTEPELDSIRMDRLNEHFQWIQLSIGEIKQIIDSSDQFMQVFQASLETYKQEFLAEYNQDIHRLEQERKKKEKEYKEELEKINAK